MSAARCPKCSATLLGSVDWCSQCYADLRPAAPAAPPAAMSPSTPPAVSQSSGDAPPVPLGTSAPDPLLTSLVTGPLDTPLAKATAEALADPLTAPIGYVSGAEPAAAAVAAAASADAPPVTAAAPVDGWPCVRCGALNEMDRMACGSCGQAFGADLATPLRVPGTRQSRILVTIGIVFGVLAMLAVVIYATTPDPPAKEKTRPESTQPVEELVEQPVP